MNAITRILLILALVAGSGYGIFLAFGSDGDEPVIVPTQFVPVEPSVDRVAPIKGVINSEPPTERKAVGTGASAAADSAQGVMGRVVDKSGTPIADVEVYLVEGHGKDLLAAMMLAQQGVIYPPVAQTTTDDFGEFRVGSLRYDAKKTYELRFVGTRHADKTLPGITIFNGKWYDAKSITLEDGLSVYGRVTVQGNALQPIAGATVSIKSNSNLPMLSPTPGRENGITTTTDEAGYYRVDNAGQGAATVIAVAEHYARIERAHTQIEGAREQEINFELPEGRMIGGVVADSVGDPIANAKVTATAISAKITMTIDTRSGRDGSFKLIGLTDGPFQIDVKANTYVNRQIKPILAGVMDLVAVLERQGSARIRVITRQQKLIKNFSLVLKSVHAGHEQFGNVQNMPMVKVRGSDLENGVYTLPGLNPGNYAFEIYSKGYAKTYSEPFAVTLGGEPPLVVVQMNAGGRIEGIVVGSNGKPLGGVIVKTLPNFLDENPFTQMFGLLIPFKISKQQTKTDRKGRYKFKLLAPGTYQLKFTHPERYDVYLKEQICEEARTTKVANVQMDLGTLVTGTVLVDGVPAAQVKVSISAHTPAELQASAVSFTADAVTDNEGRFVVGRRLPPGHYEARAARQVAKTPFDQIFDYQKTQQKFEVGPGQMTYELHFSFSN